MPAVYVMAPPSVNTAPPPVTGQIILGGVSGYNEGTTEANFLTSLGATPSQCVIVGYSNANQTTWAAQLGNYTGQTGGSGFLGFPGAKCWSFAMAISGDPLDWAAITGGAHDSTFNSMFTWAANNNVQVMRPAWEFNLGQVQYPWGIMGNDSSANWTGFVAAWQHVWNLANAIRPNYFKWWWNPTYGLGPSSPLTSIYTNYYPGDAYVDGVGLDIYNEYPPSSTWPGDAAWLTAMTTGTDPNWNDTVSFCTSHGKALIVPEWAPAPFSNTSGQPSSPGDDATFVTNMFGLFTAAANAGLTVYSFPYNAGNNWANFPNALAQLKTSVATAIAAGLIA